MRDKKTYKMCARLYPHERQCCSCPHKNCSLRDLNNSADSHEEKAVSMFCDDQRDRIRESVVLGN